MKPLRMRLLNDYEVILAGLRSMLAPYADRIEVVEVDVQDTADQPVDLTLFDTFGREQVHRPEVDEYFTDPKAGAIVIYSWNTDPSLVSIALNKGCRGYIDKGASVGELVAALERIAAGDTVVLRGAADSRRDVPGTDGETIGAEHSVKGRSERVATHDWPGRQAGLTLREAEVVALITQGYTNDEIADLSFISGNTLKSRIRAAYRKMGVERRSQAVRWGIEHGMLLPQHD